MAQKNLEIDVEFSYSINCQFCFVFKSESQSYTEKGKKGDSDGFNLVHPSNDPVQGQALARLKPAAA